MTPLEETISGVVTQTHTTMIVLFIWKEKFSKLLTTKNLTFFTIIIPTAAKEVDTKLCCHRKPPIYSGLFRPSSVRYFNKGIISQYYVFLCPAPPWMWLKKAETCSKSAVWYTFISNSTIILLFNIKFKHCYFRMIAVFRRDANDVCTLLGFCAS